MLQRIQKHPSNMSGRFGSIPTPCDLNTPESLLSRPQLSQLTSEIVAFISSNTTQPRFDQL